MANMNKPPKIGGSSAIKQMRGPGENLGLKKPRIGAIPKPKLIAPPPMGVGTGAGMGSPPGMGASGSYLPKLAGGGKVSKSKPKSKPKSKR